MRTGLFIALGIFAAFYLAVWVPDIAKEVARDWSPWFTRRFHRPDPPIFSTRWESVPTRPPTSFFKLWRLVPDEQIPGTLNVGHTIPTLIEAFIFIAVVQVDPVTLVSMMPRRR